MEASDRPEDDAYQRLAHLASRLLRSPVAIVALLDGNRLRFAGAVGLPGSPAHGWERPLSEAIWQQTVETGEPVVVEDAREHPAMGKFRWVREFGAASYAGVPLVDSGGTILGTLCVMDTRPRKWKPQEIQDLLELAETARVSVHASIELAECRHVEEALRTRERQFATAQQLAQLGSWEWDIPTDTVTWSQELYRIFGLSEDEFKPTLEGYLERVHPEDRERVRATIHDAMARGSFEFECRFVRPSGEVRYEFAQGKLFRDEQGQPARMTGVALDITERKRAEEDLKAAQAHLEHLVQSSPAVLYTAEAEGSYGTTYISPNIREQLGYDPEDFTGDPAFWADHIHPDDRPRIFSAIPSLFETGHHVHEYRFRRRDGSWRWMRDELRLLRDEAGKPQKIVGYWIDITQRKQTEEALLETARIKERFATAIENLSTGVLITDPQQPDNPIIYTNPGFLAITGYLEDEILGRNARFLQGPETDPALVREIRQAIGERCPFKGRILNYRKDGAPFWNEMTISPVFDSQGELINFVGLQSDVTEQVRAERQIQAQLKEKTVLLQEVHHRVKNNLQIISSLLNMQIRALQDPHATKALQESRSRIQAIALAHEMLYRSHSFAQVDLADYLRNLVHWLHRSQGMGRRIELELELQSCSVPLSQAVSCGLVTSELVSNALKHAFPDDRPGHIRVALQTDGTACILIVSDNGVGLPEDLDLRRSRSVGLQLVDDLTHQLKGVLEFRRHPGTEFRIAFTPAKSTA